MPPSIHYIVHALIICFGTTLNLTTIAAIVLRSSGASKEYSLLLLNTALVELSSVLAKFIVDGRLFVDALAMTGILEGPCRYVSDRFCAVVTGFLHVNMVHSHTILALSFWYRTRILLDKRSFGRWRLQAVIGILYIPHIANIVASLITASPRTMLEPIVDQFYGANSTSGLGMHGFVGVSDLGPAGVMAHLAILPMLLNIYIFYTRRRLIRVLQEQTQFMSANTKSVHESFTAVLTISALSIVVVPLMMGIAVCVQMFYEIHSIDIEGFGYDVAVMPALINPALTLYFVRSYREFVQRGLARLTCRKIQQSKISVSIGNNSDSKMRSEALQNFPHKRSCP